MKEKKAKFNKLIYGSWVSSILFLAFGIFLFVKPKLANSVIGYVVGALVLLSGLIALFNYFFAKKEIKYISFELIY